MATQITTEDAQRRASEVAAVRECPTGTHTGKPRVAPLSFAQERLWFLDQLEPGLPVYNIPRAFRLGGRLDSAALQQALDEIVRRHESLRTTFGIVDDSPQQIVAPSLHLRLVVRDLEATEGCANTDEAARIAAAEAATPFDLAGGPLVRAMLLRLAPDDHLLVITMHHIVSEGGWSMNIFLHELGSLYGAYTRGESPSLAPLPIQYSDYALWQRERLQGALLERELAYWRGQLAGAPAVVHLPTDRPRPAQQSYRGARAECRLPRQLSERLLVMSRAEGVTVAMTLLAAWLVVLYRYTDRDDLLLWMPVAGRTHLDVEGLIGFFVNTLALRVNAAGNPPFRELLDRVREVSLGVFGHQELPFARLVEALRPQRVRGRTPPLQLMFAPQPVSGPPLELDGIEVRPFGIDSGTTTSDLALFTWEEPAGIRLALEYSMDLFAPDRMHRMLGHYRTVLQGIVADASRRLSTIPLLTDAERYQLLVEWSSAEHHVPSIGPSVDGKRVYVLDERLQPVAVGVPGSLFVGGNAVLWDERIGMAHEGDGLVPDPFSSVAGARLLRTGDRACWLADGTLAILGRLHDRVELHGVPMDLGEVDAAIAAHPAVRACHSTLREDRPGEQRLVAYVVGDEDSVLSPAALSEFLHGALSAWMVPSFLVGIPVLPLTAEGEVDREALPVPSAADAMPPLAGAPRSALELQLTELWEELLGVTPIRVRENFFELGGHSLMAVRLFSAIEQRLGQRLPLSTLLRAPTIAQLAAVLEADQVANDEAIAGTRHGERERTRWSSLVAIREDGDRPPLICVHGSGGNVVGYRRLADYLGPGQPCYGLQARGLDGVTAPITRLEEMAANYVAELRAAWPNGPYALCGLSFGGTVAFEMARQLQEEGQSVALVALFDSRPFHTDWTTAGANVYRRLTRLAGMLGSHLRKLRSLPPASMPRYIRAQLRTQLHLARTTIWRRRYRRYRGTRRPDRSLPFALQNVERSCELAFREYVPRPYSGKVTLFRAAIRGAGEGDDPVFGWGHLATDGVEIHDVPGSHVTMLNEPNVAPLAEQLSACLARAFESAATGPSLGSGLEL